MNTLTLDNFRCFANTGKVPIRPLTVLIGENSTGKSSFLAAVRLAWDIAQGRGPIDFNEEPFLLGAFEQIAHFRGGRAGRARLFSIGSSWRAFRVRRIVKDWDDHLEIYNTTSFRKLGSHPEVHRQTLVCGDYQIAVTLPEDGGRAKLQVRVTAPTVRKRVDRKAERILDISDVAVRIGTHSPIDWTYVAWAIGKLPAKDSRSLEESSSLTEGDVLAIRDIMVNAGNVRMNRPVAIAPVRTRPQRTYNPVSDAPLPEGGHVPMVLAKSFFERKERWRTLKAALDKFGEQSGLFSSLEIKALGRHESDPFQIRVKVGGPASNLVDVGYGVSQVLPILVDSLLATQRGMFLLQQPEVHLHPKAQAALGSFIGQLVARYSKHFVLETHSDYLLDRLRLDVRDGKLNPDDVSFLYFERNGVEVDIHPMVVDDRGNLLHAPPSYRRFFMEEERRFLGL